MSAQPTPVPDVPHPLQPLYTDVDGVVRFKPNAIVCYLLDHGGIDLNTIASLSFSEEDQEQFAQLIGYSLSGWGELSYVRDATYNQANSLAAAAGLVPPQPEAADEP